jgi:hypothetical protein
MRVYFQPDSYAVHLTIEKTAAFVKAQGPQAEILLKVKQANDPKFSFMQEGHRLHDYYNLLKTSDLVHVPAEKQSAIKSTTSEPPKETKETTGCISYYVFKLYMIRLCE